MSDRPTKPCPTCGFAPDDETPAEWHYRHARDCSGYVPDPISVANAEQSRRLQTMGNRNDRADITSGNGYSRHDGNES